MKYSVFAKFIAIVLCAAFLLSAAGSGLGMFCLAQSDLYDQSVDQLYEDSRESLAQIFANQIAFRYASETLGNCPPGVIDYYPLFQDGYYGYTLTDSAGNVLQSQELAVSTEQVWQYRFQVQDEYEKFLGPENDEPDYDDLHIIDNVTVDGMAVDELFFYSESGASWHFESHHLGKLYRGVNSVILQTQESELQFLQDVPLITQVSCFYGGALLYQISCSDGVGTFQTDDDGYIHIVFHQEPTATVPVTTNPAPEDYIYNCIPNEGTDVQRVSFTYLGIDDIKSETQSYGSDEVLGKLFTREDGAILFVISHPQLFPTEGGTVSHAAFYGMDGELLYETYCAGGAGAVLDSDDSYLFNNSYVSFVSWLELYKVPNSAPVTENPTEAPTEAEPSYIIYDAIPPEGAYVGNVAYRDSNGSSTFSINLRTGFLAYNADGAVIFRTEHPSPVKPDGDTFYHVAFYGLDNQLLYEAAWDEGVGTFRLDEDGYLFFTSRMESVPDSAPEDTTEPVTEPVTIPDTTTATEVVETPVTIPQETVIAELLETTPPEDYYTTHYYDSETGAYIPGRFVYEPMPEPYFVELALAKGAYEMDIFYDLLQFVWRYQNQLIYVLAASLLGFAITAAYLCCAAGRKKGRSELRAGGINCLSLDVYLIGGGFAVCALSLLGVEGGYYLMRQQNPLLFPCAVILGYAVCLMVVGFCFACAAQFKTPGGYWWKNTLTARCFRLLIRVFRMLETFLGTSFFPLLGRILKACWRLTKRLWKYLCAFSITAYQWMDTALTWLGQRLIRIFHKLSAWVHRFLVMLPVTWQWLIIGMCLLLILVMAMDTRSEEIFFVTVLVCIALVIYGSHCFGLLLEGTKRMSKGDLETKVDKKLMLGSFREFAGDLNALADVAVVAAQKQMKSERMKAELITNVSHDIKTPLTSIINYVDLLQKPHTDEEAQTYLEVLSRQSQRMKKLLEDLIEMSKASTGNMTVNIARINAEETLAQALGEFADKLEQAHLTTLVQQPEQPVYMQADGRLTWRVLSNLLSNTVKYALPGTRVYLDLMTIGDKVLISIKNISREALNVSADELTERFVRGDASRNTDGSGLGLNIAQSLMEIQKGKLELTVDGDLFKVTLIFPAAEA